MSQKSYKLIVVLVTLKTIKLLVVDSNGKLLVFFFCREVS